VLARQDLDAKIAQRQGVARSDLPDLLRWDTQGCQQAAGIGRPKCGCAGVVDHLRHIRQMIVVGMSYQNKMAAGDLGRNQARVRSHPSGQTPERCAGEIGINRQGLTARPQLNPRHAEPAKFHRTDLRHVTGTSL
jgi:hypothetical protein